jgi:hypothetical protein
MDQVVQVEGRRKVRWEQGDETPANTDDEDTPKNEYVENIPLLFLMQPQTLL